MASSSGANSIVSGENVLLLKTRESDSSTGSNYNTYFKY